ncbi:hypothetical protein H6P81_013954 [Aristolochia fimbriata]|uniref:PTC1-like winged helix-turn-helix domain-containing protein n=1 Tax=Aristolochia fimbriata TaxID=158543 RepID=A0AAV7EJH3_ARIFI|nr:hypothetical protein H6P81_013954 [Aristolochia fimbriata]
MSGVPSFWQVSEKTKLNVTVKFPSALSLRNYFSDNYGAKSSSMEHPLLDEEFVMGTSLASRVLQRKVPPLKFAQNKQLPGFWMISPMTPIVKAEIAPPSNSPLTRTSTGLLTWGARRKVRFLGRHRERPPSLSIIKADVGRATRETRSRKRRCEAFGANIKRKKSRDNEKAKINSKDRWSKERYAAAEQKLLEIMREQGAFLGKPILRPALRMEARKHIGDTGLLDHLLKHMAGMVNEERGERLRRCHNAEGQMEYWLESAELEELRKDAGVKDPYWVPPPGWKPGENPYLDPETSNQIKLLKEDVGCMRRDLEQLRSTKSNSDQEENALALTKCSENDRGPITSSLEEKYDRLQERYNMLEERYEEMYSTLKVVKEEMRVLTGSVVEKRRKEVGEQERCGDARNNSLVRSGFRMCKPQGTFLWPNMAQTTSLSSAQWIKQEEDIFSAAAASTGTPNASPFSFTPLLALPPVPTPTPISYSPLRPVAAKPVVVYSRRSTSVVSGTEAVSPYCDRWSFTGARTLSSVSATSSAFLCQMPPAVPVERERVPLTGHGRRIPAADLAGRHASSGSWLALATPSPPKASNHP